MKHLGDITKIDGSAIESVDVITFGSPCQDLSVAGKRAGLAGERSGLFMEAVRIFKEMREHERQLYLRGTNEPVRHLRWAIWENVPGALSSNNGEDFRCVLEELARVSEEGVSIPRPEKGKWRTAGCIVGEKWSIAWRVMDAQYWGVPQRRRRISLLADFDGQDAGRILFEQCECRRNTVQTDSDEAVMDTGEGRESEVQPIAESLQWYPCESIAPWKGIARNPEGSTDEASWTMKIRHAGSEPNGSGGVGPLVQTEKSATLRPVNEQTLF